MMQISCEKIDNASYIRLDNDIHDESKDSK